MATSSDASSRSRQRFYVSRKFCGDYQPGPVLRFAHFAQCAAIEGNEMRPARGSFRFLEVRA
jgi:hypothetical protein